MIIHCIWDKVKWSCIHTSDKRSRRNKKVNDKSWRHISDRKKIKWMVNGEIQEIKWTVSYGDILIKSLINDINIMR